MSFKSATTGEIVLSPQEKTGKRSAESIAKQKETIALNKSIKATVYEELKKQLLNGKATPYYKSFIANYLKEAKDKPDSKPAQVVAQTIFQQEILKLLDEAHDKEIANDREFTRYKLMKTFFKEQREVIYEINHSKQIVVCCSRRAGKTDLASGAILYAALIPNSRIIYLNLTFSNAITQIFDNIIERANICGLSIESSSKSSGEVTFSNNSSIRILGNSNNAEIDKLRGEKKVSLVVIDEFFHQRNMEYAINEVIGPLLIDRRDSSILCMGTPPRIPKTYGEKVWNENGWKKFHWTARDNPYIPNYEDYIDNICKAKGLDRTAPFILREYEGIIGVYDKEAMVYKDAQIVDMGKTNEDHVNYLKNKNFKADYVYIGVDFGYSDYNGICAVAWNNQLKKGYVFAENKFNHSTVSDIVTKINEIAELSKTVLINSKSDIKNYRIFTDNNEKSITFELVQNYKLPAQIAYKYDKATGISQLADDLRTRIYVAKNGFIHDEIERTVYERDEEDNITNKIDDKVFHPDILDALLYAHRQIIFDNGVNQ